MNVSNFTVTSTFIALEVGAASDSGHGECIPDHVLGIPALLHFAAQTRWLRHHHRPAACAIAASVRTWRVSALHCSVAWGQCTQAALGIHCDCKHHYHADGHGHNSRSALHGCLKGNGDTNRGTKIFTGLCSVKLLDTLVRWWQWRLCMLFIWYMLTIYRFLVLGALM